MSKPDETVVKRQLNFPILPVRTAIINKSSLTVKKQKKKNTFKVQYLKWTEIFF